MAHSLEEIIEKANYYYNTTIFSTDYLMWWLIIIGLLTLVIIGVVKMWDEMAITLPFIFAIVIFVGGLIQNHIVDEKEREKIEENWIQEYALPYIKNLPEQKSEIIYIKLDPEIKSTVRGNWMYTYTTHKNLVPMTISYKSNGNVYTVTDWISTDITLTSEEKPYITYRQLEHNLGYGYKKGLYDKVIYLPEDYTFTDIK